MYVYSTWGCYAEGEEGWEEKLFTLLREKRDAAQTTQDNIDPEKVHPKPDINKQNLPRKRRNGEMGTRSLRDYRDRSTDKTCFEN
jgi:hypothetical protein